MTSKPTWLCPVCGTGVQGFRVPEDPAAPDGPLMVQCEDHYARGGQVCPGSGQRARGNR